MEGSMKRVIDRARQVSLSLTESEFERYKRLAEAEGKSFSKWVRDKVEEAIKREIREVNLLERLIKLLEEPPEGVQVKGSSNEEINQFAKLLVYLIKLFELQSEYTIVLEAKKKEFQARKDQLKRELGIEV
jgi:hypothetical protein